MIQTLLTELDMKLHFWCIQTYQVILSGTAAGRSNADVFQGTAWYLDTADNSVEGFNAAGTDTLILDGTTRGGLGGSMVYCRAAADGIWLIQANLNGNGTMVTPWS
jgi:hypothetical protein